MNSSNKRRDVLNSLDWLSVKHFDLASCEISITKLIYSDFQVRVVTGNFQGRFRGTMSNEREFLKKLFNCEMYIEVYIMKMHYLKKNLK